MNKDLEIFLGQHFSLDKFGNSPDVESEYLKHIQKLLSYRIKFMIESDMDKLLQILYRIDVGQHETDKAFELGEIHKVSMKLAEEIIKRQLKKIEYARKFNRE